METITPIQWEEKSSTTQDNQEEQQDSQEENSSKYVDFDFSDLVKLEKFKKKVKRIKVTLTEDQFDFVAKRLQLTKEWILQVLSKFPDILDDNDGKEIFEYIQTRFLILKI